MLSKISKKYLQQGCPKALNAGVMQQQQVAAFHQVSSFTSKSSSSNTYLLKNNGLFGGSNQQRFGFSSDNEAAEKPAFKNVEEKRYQRRSSSQDNEGGAERSSRPRHRDQNSGKLRPSSTSNMSNNLPLDEVVAQAAKNLSAASLEVNDVAVLLRHLTRQISIKNQTMTGSQISRDIRDNEELRKNIIIIGQEVEKHIPNVPARLLSEFTNLLNVYRNNDIEIPNSLKQAITSRVKAIFQDKKFAEELKELNFDQTAKIFSDMIHLTNVNSVASYIAKNIPEGRSTIQDKGDEIPALNKNFVSVMRIVDSIGSNPSQVEYLDFLIRKLEQFLREEENFNLLNINQCTRALKTFSYASHANIMNLSILDRLVRQIHMNIESLRETDVLTILRAYQYLPSETKFSTRLINDLNSTVVTTAVENKEQVSIPFLINYLHQFFHITSRQNNNRDLTKEQRQALTSLLEEKLEASKSDKGFNLNHGYVLGLSRVLIRNPRSDIIREILAEATIKFAPKLKYEDIQSSLYAIRNSLNLEKSTENQDKYNQFGLDFIARLKEGSKSTRNCRVLAERVFNLEAFFNHLPEGHQLAQELSEQFNLNYAKAPQLLGKAEGANIIVSCYSRTNDTKKDSLSLNIVKQIAEYNYGTAEAIKTAPISSMIDILIYVQRESNRFSWMNESILPNIAERLKNMSVGNLQNYIRRLVNFEDLLPAMNRLNMMQARRILEFINKQEEAKHINPTLIYKLIEKIIADAKSWNSSINKNQPSFSKQFERYRIDALLNQVLCNYPEQRIKINDKFIELMSYTTMNMQDTPSFFLRSIRQAITNGVAPKKKSQIEMASDDSLVNYVSPNQYLAAIGALRTVEGTVPATYLKFILEYTKNPLFSVKRIEKDLHIGGQNESNSTESSTYNQMIIKGLRIVFKIQKRNQDDFKEIPDQYVSDKTLETVAQSILAEAIKADEAGKSTQVIGYLSALSDYPDSTLDYQKNETTINRIIKEAFKKMSIRQAYTYFLQVLGNERAQQSRKLSQKLMKEFSINYQTTFGDASPHQIVKITEKFAEHGWMLALTYNSLIEAFGKNFDSFSYRELASFNKSLSKVGLRQADIIEESIKKLTSSAGKSKNKSDAENVVAPTSQADNYNIQFKETVAKLFEAITDLDLPNQDDLIAKLTEESFIKRAIPGQTNFSEQVLRERSSLQSKILLGILKGRLDQKNEQFKELAEKIIANFNESGLELDETAVQLYEALALGNSGLATNFVPNALDKIKFSYEREKQNKKISKLYESSKIQPALQALGYSDVTFNTQVGGYFFEFYSPSKNLAILALDSHTLCYDRETPNGTFRLKERTTNSLSEKPNIHSVNLFTLNTIVDKEAKIKYLTEQCGIPLVAESVDLNVQGL